MSEATSTERTLTAEVSEFIGHQLLYTAAVSYIVLQKLVCRRNGKSDADFRAVKLSHVKFAARVFLKVVDGQNSGDSQTETLAKVERVRRGLSAPEVAAFVDRYAEFTRACYTLSAFLHSEVRKAADIDDMFADFERLYVPPGAAEGGAGGADAQAGEAEQCSEDASAASGTDEVEGAASE